MLEDIDNSEWTSTTVGKFESYNEMGMIDDFSQAEEFPENINDDNRFEDNEEDTRGGEEENDDDYEDKNREIGWNEDLQTITTTEENSHEKSDEKMEQDKLIQRRNVYAEKARKRNSYKALIAELELLRVAKGSENESENVITRGRTRDPIPRVPHSNAPRVRDASPSITKMYNDGVGKLRAEYARSVERRNNSDRFDTRNELDRLQRLVAKNKLTSCPKAETLYNRGVEKLRHHLTSIERTKQEDELKAMEKEQKLKKLITAPPAPLSPSTEKMYNHGVAKLRAQSVEKTESQEMRLHRLAANANENPAADRMYNRGVAKLREKTAERTRANDSLGYQEQLEKLNKLVTSVRPIPAADRMYQQGFLKLRAQSVERIRSIHSESVQLPTTFMNAGPNAERLYNLGVSKMRSQSLERKSLIEAYDTKKQLEKLSKLVSKTKPPSRNTERLYNKGVMKIRIDMKRSREDCE